MSKRMARGSNVTLTREIPGLTGAVVGVRWDAGAGSSLGDDLVLAAMLCDADGQVLSAEDFVFFNQIASPELSTRQVADVLGDDQEQVEVEFALVPERVQRIVVVLYLNEVSTRRRSLGQLRSCEVRLLGLADNAELVRSEDFSPLIGQETGIALCELYRHAGEWKFKVLGQCYPTGIRGIAADYGVPL